MHHISISRQKKKKSKVSRNRPITHRLRGQKPYPGRSGSWAPLHRRRLHCRGLSRPGSSTLRRAPTPCMAGPGIGGGARHAQRPGSGAGVHATPHARIGDTSAPLEFMPCDRGSCAPGRGLELYLARPRGAVSSHTINKTVPLRPPGFAPVLAGGGQVSAARGTSGADAGRHARGRSGQGLPGRPRRLHPQPPAPRAAPHARAVTGSAAP